MRTALTLAAAVSITAAAAMPTNAAPTRPADLVVAVHPDDEMTLTALWTNTPGVDTVILWLDQTTTSPSSTINPATGQPARWEPGEYNPLDFPGGFTTGYFRGSLANLNALRKVDASIPRLIYEDGTDRRIGGRTVTTWTNPGRGHAIAYRLPARNVTPATTRAAINDITTRPGKYGLPTNLRWRNLIASNYYNRTPANGKRCTHYQNPTHANANTGTVRYAYPQFTGWRAYPICKDDPASNRHVARPTAALTKAAYSKGGTIQKYFGWLYTKSPNVYTDRSSVFSSEQWYTLSPTNVGH